MPPCEGCQGNIQNFTINQTNYNQTSTHIAIFSTNGSQNHNYIFCPTCKANGKYLNKLMENWNLELKYYHEESKKKLEAQIKKLEEDLIQAHTFYALLVNSELLKKTAEFDEFLKKAKDASQQVGSVKLSEKIEVRKKELLDKVHKLAMREIVKNTQTIIEGIKELEGF